VNEAVAPYLVQKGSMGKRIIVVVLLLILALFAYVGYHSYDSKRAGASGEVYSNGAVRRAEAADPADSEPEAVVYPSTVTPAATQSSQPMQTSTPAPVGATQVTQTQQPAGANAPASDTISPNPPNGMAFSGSGRYQLYRQGNLTWRLDTDTGHSCIIFATDEEWHKPRVYRAACGKS
jgi:hypothetical protein